MGSQVAPGLTTSILLVTVANIQVCRGLVGLTAFSALALARFCVPPCLCYRLPSCSSLKLRDPIDLMAQEALGLLALL